MPDSNVGKDVSRCFVPFICGVFLQSHDSEKSQMLTTSSTPRMLSNLEGVHLLL